MFASEEWIHQFPPSFVERGRQYFKDGHVAHVWIDTDEESIDGIVHNGRGQEYEQSIWRSNSRHYPVRSICSCPLQGDCKHVIAVLLAAVQQQTESPRTCIPDTLPPESSTGATVPMSAWQERTLSRLAAREETWPAHIKQRVLYIVSCKATGFFVQPHSAYKRKRGPYSQRKKLDARTFLYGRSGVPLYVLDSDVALLDDLYRAGTDDTADSTAGLFISGAHEHSASLLLRLARSNRCFHESLLNKNLLQLSSTEQSTSLSWQSSDNGIILSLDNSEITPCILNAALYLRATKTHTEIGPLHLSYPTHQVQIALDMPAIRQHQLHHSSLFLAEHLPDLPTLPEPSTSRAPKKPVPHLFLGTEQLVWQTGQRAIERALHSICKPVFSYDDQFIEYYDTREAIPIHNKTDSSEKNVLRHYQNEHQRLEELRDAGFFQLETHEHLIPPPAFSSWWSWLPHTESHTALGSAFSPLLLPELEKLGWIIHAPEEWNRTDILDPDDWFSQIEEQDSLINWFDLHLGVHVGNERINLLPVIAGLLEQPDPLAGLHTDKDSSLVPLGGSRYLRLPTQLLTNLLTHLFSLFDSPLSNDGTLSLSLGQSASLTELDKHVTDLRWTGGQRQRDIGKKLTDIRTIAPLSPPTDFQATLRPYQQDGLAWLQFIRELGMGGILADDMGLGKTIQALAHIHYEKNAGRLDKPCLVVAPTSVIGNWKRETDRFAPSLRTMVFHGTDRHKYAKQFNMHDIIFTTYALLHRDSKHFSQHSYHALILDEAQYIKNPLAKATRAACSLQAHHRICLTGTPIENHLGELWSQFNFLNPGLLGDHKRFTKFFRTPIEKHLDGDKKNMLARRVSPFIIRRTKELVASDLPEKTEIIQSISLNDEQKNVYESVRLAMDKKVRTALSKHGLARSHILVLEALLKLRQVCCHPRLLKTRETQHTERSAKLDRLMELLPTLIEDGRRILLFSQFTSMLSLIASACDEAEIPYITLTGRTKNRQKLIDRFQDDNSIPLFLISLKAGGTGLNLTAADTVIHYDPWWNPAVERQATDRAHRIGQDKPVFVYKLITEGTVEEKICDLHDRKTAIAHTIFSNDGSANPKLTDADIEELLKPL